MSFFDTEIATEVLLFSVDAIFGIILLKSYNTVSRFISSVQEVSAKGANDKLDKAPDERPEYVMVHGSVRALGIKIPSMHVPNVSGVVQKIRSSKLVMARNSSGFWWEESRPIHESFNAVPFAIVVGKYVVNVQDVQLADDLQLVTVYNNFTPTAHSFASNLWSFFFGIRQYGIQTTEEMLKEGTFVTGVGDLLTSADGSQVLMPPAAGKPYFIITRPLSSLLQDLRDKKTYTGILLLLTGGISIYFGSKLARRLWTSLKKRLDKNELQRRIAENRRLRRQNVRDGELPEYVRCVVCQDNPREVILLPCGHVCLCEDCSEQLTSTCPVCRSHIATRAAAFLA